MLDRRLVLAMLLGCALPILFAPSAVHAKRVPPRPTSASHPVTRAGELPGDVIGNAFVVPALPFTVSGSTCGFTDDYLSDICGPFYGGDVVYAYTPATDERFTASACGAPFECSLTLFEDSELNRVACNVWGCGFTDSPHLTARLRAGHTYYVVVDTWDREVCGDYTLVLAVQPAAAAGESFADAIPVPALPFTDARDSFDFSRDIDLECVPPSSPDVVYRFVPATDVCLRASTCGSDYDTALGLFEGGPLGPIACNDDADSCPDEWGLSSLLDGALLLAGHEYFVVVSGYEGSGGTYVLQLASDCQVTPSRRSSWGQLKAHYR